MYAQEVQAEGVEDAAPIRADFAQQLDHRIRIRVAAIRDGIADLDALIIEAKHGGIHAALGFSSWTAYLADALSGLLDIELTAVTRRALVFVLAGEGMSQRGIAQALNVSKSAVQRDLAEVVHDGPPATVGLDGKTYTRHRAERPVARWDRELGFWVSGTDPLGRPVPYNDPIPPVGYTRSGVMYAPDTKRHKRPIPDGRDPAETAIKRLRRTVETAADKAGSAAVIALLREELARLEGGAA